MLPSRGTDPKAVAKGMVLAAQLSGLGTELAVLMLGGYWLDRRWGCWPALFLLGAVSGLYLFVAGVIRIARDANKKL